MTHDRDRPPNLPAAESIDSEGAGLELTRDREFAETRQPIASGDGHLHRFPGGQFEATARRDPGSAQAASITARVAEPS